jgi:flagellar hook assembly protein FlgD
VYDVAGREVRILIDQAVYAPVMNVEWDGRNKAGRRVPSGMYFIKARAAEVSDTKKVLVIR